MDDFEDDNNDIEIDQRHHERQLKELYNSGYRDGYQITMENETSLQQGFNCGYKSISKIAFLIGTIRSSLDKYKFTNDSDLYEMDHDLMKLKVLIETIENQLITNEKYEEIFKNNENVDELNKIFEKFNENLLVIRDYLSSNTNEASNLSSVSIMSENLSKLIDQMNNSIINTKK